MSNGAVVQETSLASRFVHLVIEHMEQNQFRVLGRGEHRLTHDEEGVLLELVQAAGFGESADNMRHGELRGDYLDDDARPTGETYPITDHCLYQVMAKSGGVSRGTTWLDEMVGEVKRQYFGNWRTSGISQDSSDGEKEARILEIVQWVETEVERSIPLEPIVLTEVGDCLREYPKSGKLVDHTRDSHQLDSCVGVHNTCNGWIDRKSTTPTHDVLLCRQCMLRIPIPNTIKTYGQLRRHFSEFNSL